MRTLIAPLALAAALAGVPAVHASAPTAHEMIAIAREAQTAPAPAGGR